LFVCVRKVRGMLGVTVFINMGVWLLFYCPLSVCLSHISASEFILNFIAFLKWKYICKSKPIKRYFNRHLSSGDTPLRFKIVFHFISLHIT
jgi:hypothetical protein